MNLPQSGPTAGRLKIECSIVWYFPIDLPDNPWDAARVTQRSSKESARPAARQGRAGALLHAAPFRGLNRLGLRGYAEGGMPLS